MNTAIVLLSGGLDSATVLAIAQSQGKKILALSFDYGQLHRAELLAAERLVEKFSVHEHLVVPLSLDRFGGSSLVDSQQDIPDAGASTGIPSTYVPARNTVFLSIALALAEARAVHDIYIGVNAMDYSGYPDCRAEFIAAFERMANLATKDGVEGRAFRIHAPLQNMTKAEIVAKGTDLGLDYRLTVSCYRANDQGLACGRCDSCELRRQGFAAAGLEDATLYQ